jgi:hypothetical protein
MRYIYLVFVFAPSSSKPVFQQPKSLDSKLLAAVFVPRPNPFASGPEWLCNSRIILVDDRQVSEKSTNSIVVIRDGVKFLLLKMFFLLGTLLLRR